MTQLRFALPLLLLLLLSTGTEAQAPTATTTPAGSTASEALTAADYERAEAFLSGNLNSRLFRASVSPNWRDDQRFDYRVRIPGGHEFISVHAGQGTRERAFGHERLSAALSRATGESYEALQLPFTSFDWVDEGRAVEVTADGRLWRCHLSEYECVERERPEAGPSGVSSPDGRYVAFRRDHDLWVFDRETGSSTQLTTDGEERYGYATDSQGWRQSDQPILLWSPDSRKIATYRLDERGVGEMHLLRTAEPRPELQSWPYALPGDTIVPMLSGWSSTWKRRRWWSWTPRRITSGPLRAAG